MTRQVLTLDVDVRCVATLSTVPGRQNTPQALTLEHVDGCGCDVMSVGDVFVGVNGGVYEIGSPEDGGQ